ncbi:MAG: hypothetical protein ACLFM7_11610, partial [Bacteroidales bacterium]
GFSEILKAPYTYEWDFEIVGFVFALVQGIQRNDGVGAGVGKGSELFINGVFDEFLFQSGTISL